MEKCKKVATCAVKGRTLLRSISVDRGTNVLIKYLKVRPRNDLFTGREPWACVYLDSDTERGCAHRTRRLEALHGLDEAPSGHGAHLDFPRLDERVAADDAPSIIERLDKRDFLAERDHELVRKHGGKQLANFAALDAEHGRHVADRRSNGRAVIPEAEKRGPPRTQVATRGTLERDDGNRSGCRELGGRRRCEGAGPGGEWARHSAAAHVVAHDLVFGCIGTNDLLVR